MTIAENKNDMLQARIFINAPIEKVWHAWTDPEHMVTWNNASDAWFTPHAENDVRPGGTLFLRMEMKDGSAGFDYRCIYDEVVLHRTLSHTNSDLRKTTIQFQEDAGGVMLTEVFEPDRNTPLAVQEAFCQSILDNFKRHVESGGFFKQL